MKTTDDEVDTVACARFKASKDFDGCSVGPHVAGETSTLLMQLAIVGTSIRELRGYALITSPLVL